MIVLQKKTPSSNCFKKPIHHNFLNMQCVPRYTLFPDATINPKKIQWQCEQSEADNLYRTLVDASGLDGTLGAGGSWEETGAVGHARWVVTEKSHAAHGISELAGPLACVANETLELFADSWVGSETRVRWEDEDGLASGWVNWCWAGSGVGVVLDVPCARGGILWGTSLCWVNTELVAGAVGTENGSEIDSRESLSLEKLVQAIRWRMNVGKMALNTWTGSVLAANQDCDLWSTWAGDNGVGAHEVDHVGNRNTVLSGQGNSLCSDWCKSTVLSTAKLELQRAITTVGETKSCVPGTAVVEDHADGSASSWVADWDWSRFVEVECCKLRGDLLPHSWACWGFAGSKAGEATLE